MGPFTNPSSGILMQGGKSRAPGSFYPIKLWAPRNYGSPFCNRPPPKSVLNGPLGLWALPQWPPFCYFVLKNPSFNSLYFSYCVAYRMTLFFKAYTEWPSFFEAFSGWPVGPRVGTYKPNVWPVTSDRECPPLTVPHQLVSQPNFGTKITLYHPMPINRPRVVASLTVPGGQQGRMQDLQKEGTECQNWGNIGWYGTKIGWICMI